MKSLLCSAVLFAGMVGLVSSSAISTAPAQDKKKDTPKATSKTGTIEINAGKDEKFRFVIRDTEGKLLAMSGPTGFATREEAVKALETLKDVLPKAVIAAPKGK